MKKIEKWRQWWKERDKQTLVLVRYSQERGGKVKYFKRHLIRRKQRRIGRKWWIKREWMDEKLHYQILLHVRKIWQLSVWVCGECVWGMCVSVWGMCVQIWCKFVLQENMCWEPILYSHYAEPISGPDSSQMDFYRESPAYLIFQAMQYVRKFL